MSNICPIVESIKIIGSKPRLLILRYLDGKSMGFNQLKRESGLSSRTLSLNLKFLLQHGIIEKNVNGNKSNYSLTRKGKNLYPIIAEIGKWGSKWKIYK
ncbi:MAG: helix-turn-helix domain-containing protein [Candidatus Aenigmatarchaeota archaeon]|nr:helix-turn-helix transcriptional regulator [Candidatus Aenigmarchaeota archaeon]